jgi:hypothetical protein
MNEICHGMSLPEFETRIGAGKADVRGILDKLLAAMPSEH